MGEEVPLWDWRQFHKTSAKQSERGHWPLPHMQAAEPGTPGGRGALLIGTFFTGAPPPLPTFRGDEQAPLLSTNGQSSTWLTRQGERRRWGCPPPPAPASLLASCPPPSASHGGLQWQLHWPGAGGKLTPAGRQLPVATCAATRRCPPHAGSRPVFLGFPGRALASDLQVLLKEIKGCITACESPAFLSGVVFHQMPPHF